VLLFRNLHSERARRETVDLLRHTKELLNEVWGKYEAVAGSGGESEHTLKKMAWRIEFNESLMTFRRQVWTLTPEATDCTERILEKISGRHLAPIELY
jgi:hypothetical protein